MSLQLTHCAYMRFCYVKWIYKTSVLGELREGEIISGRSVAGLAVRVYPEWGILGKSPLLLHQHVTVCRKKCLMLRLNRTERLRHRLPYSTFRMTGGFHEPSRMPCWPQ